MKIYLPRTANAVGLTTIRLLSPLLQALQTLEAVFIFIRHFTHHPQWGITICFFLFDATSMHKVKNPSLILNFLV